MNVARQSIDGMERSRITDENLGVTRPRVILMTSNQLNRVLNLIVELLDGLHTFQVGLLDFVTACCEKIRVNFLEQ